MKAPSSRSATDSLARPAGFLFLALIPLVTLIPYERVPVWLAQDLALRWGALLVFLLLTAGIFLKAKGPQTVTFDLSSSLLLALAGWVVLSTKNSLHSFDSFYAFKSFLALLLWWLSLRLLWDKHPSAFARFERVFTWTACIAALWLLATTLGHKLGMKAILENGLYPREGPFPNQNIAAGFLGMFLVWQLLRALHRERVNWFGFILVFLAWGLTESRGALVAMAFTILTYLVIHMREVEAKLRRWGPKEWGWFALTLLLLLIPLSFMLNRLFHFLGDLGDDPRSFFRFDIWLVSLQMIETRPLLGFGPGTFGDVFANFRPGTFWNVGTNFAHNEYLQVGAECGLPALLLLSLLLAALFHGFFGIVRKAKAFLPLGQVTGTAEVAFFLLILESFHCLVDFTFHEWSHRLILLAFLTRALVGIPKDLFLSLDLRATRPIFLTGGSLLVLLLVWALGVGGARDHAAKSYAYQAALAVGKGELDQAEALSRKALRVRDNFPVAWDALGTLSRTRGEAIQPGAKKEKYFRQADECFRKAIALSPYTQAYLEHQVQAMFARGRLEQALDLQVALVERFPRLPNQYKNLALVLMKLGRPQGALAAAQRSIELDHYYIPGHSLKGQALMALERYQEALITFEEEKKVLERMGRVDPTGQVEAHIKLLKAKLGDKN